MKVRHRAGETERKGILIVALRDGNFRMTKPILLGCEISEVRNRKETEGGLGQCLHVEKRTFMCLSAFATE